MDWLQANPWTLLYQASTSDDATTSTLGTPTSSEFLSLLQSEKGEQLDETFHRLVLVSSQCSILQELHFQMPFENVELPE